eukprot:gene600-1159_t
MGGDISVFEDGELESIYNHHYGPKDETTSQLFARMFGRMKSLLIQPKRMQYVTSDLYPDSLFPTSYNLRELLIDSAGMKLKCVYWERVQPNPNCILYLHTNTRSVVDALETMPLCDKLGLNLFAFDLPGCGQSEGKLSFHMANDIQNIIKWIVQNTSITNIVLWGRGMASAPLIEWTSKSPLNCVKFIILDSPFTSIQNIITDIIKELNKRGYFIPTSLTFIFGKIIRKYIKSSLGHDPYDINSLSLASKCHLPCIILSAENDDYIPKSHGEQIASSWNGSCQWHSFRGHHFGKRDLELIMLLEESISEVIMRRTISANDLAQLAMSCNRQSFLSKSRNFSSSALKGMC